MNRPATFRQADLKRAIRCVQSCELPVEGVEITKDGTIRVLTIKQEQIEPDEEIDL